MNGVMDDVDQALAELEALEGELGAWDVGGLNISSNNTDSNDDDTTTRNTLSPLIATSRARKALEKAKIVYDEGVKNSEINVEVLQRNVDICRQNYVRCVHNSAPTVVFQVVASFLNMRERCIYSVCSKFLHDEVVFGEDSAPLVWRYSSTYDLYYMCKAGMLRVLKQIIRGGGVDINWKNPVDAGATALMWACAFDNVAVVATLLEANASVHHCENDGFDALMVASQEGNTQIVEILLQASAPIDQQDSRGNTALMWSCKEGHSVVVDMLVRANANLNLQNREGCSALMLACAKGYTATAEVLMNANADIFLQNSDGENAMTLALRNSHNGTLALFQ